MPTPPLDPELQKEIYRLRQVEHLSAPEIQKITGVSTKMVTKYGGPPIPESEKKRKSALQQKQIENLRQNDEAISARTGKKIEDITEKDRREFIQHQSNKRANPHNSQLKSLRKFIKRSFPENWQEILKDSDGKNRKLADILSNPIIRSNFGNLIDDAISGGMDIVSGATKQSEKSTKLLSQLRKDMQSSVSTLVDLGEESVKDTLSRHKAREFSYAKGGGQPDSDDWKRGRQWVDSLLPAEYVEAEGPIQLKHIINTALRTPEGKIDENARRVYHHKNELGQGYPHTFNQNDFEIVSEEAHKKIHADPSFTGKPPVGPPDPGFVRRTILNLKDIPGVVKAGKVAARALPFLGAAFDAQAASEHFSKGNEVLGILAGAQAIPVLGDAFGIPLAAAELGGLGINALIDDYNISNRKKRKGEMNLFDYQPSGSGW